MNVSTDQWRAAIGLFHSYSITTSCVGIRIDLVFILNWLYKYQSGFLPNHSTTLQLMDIYHHICQTFDNNQYACTVFATSQRLLTGFGIKVCFLN